MEKFLGFIKTAKEQSPYFNMILAAILFIIIIFPAVLDPAMLDKIPQVMIWRQKFFNYIIILFIVCAVIGFGQAMLKVVENRRKKRELSTLMKLNSTYQIKYRILSHESFIEWAIQVAPLLKFNTFLYESFCQNLNQASKNVGPLSKHEVNAMKTQVSLAIKELEKHLKIKRTPNQGN